MNKSIFSFIFKAFIVWRGGLFFVAYLAGFVLPVFGGRFPYYDTVLQITHLPNWIWGFGNFDGVHYLKLAQDGYNAAFYQSFFPLYPLLIKFLNFFPKNTLLDVRTFVDPSYFYIGLILSNVLFIGLLYYFYKLLRLDYSDKIVRLSIIFLLVFPTSFYFGAIYTESLFLLLAVSSVYFFRTKKYLLSGILAAFASATRIIGVFVPILFLIEIIMERKRINLGQTLSVILSPLGLAAYMYYLYVKFGNALAFISSQPGFGAQRSAVPLISLPQVIYRYFKILTTIDVKSLPFLNAGLELGFTVIILTLLLVFYRRIRPSYLIFSLLALILPTLTGTLSSMPRYVLMAFPIFPLLAGLFPKKYGLIIGFMIILQVVLLAMFIRGYWVA